MIKTTIAWIFIFSGILIGIWCICKGIAKNRKEEEKFHLLHFLRKGLRQTPLSNYLGVEIIALGVLAILLAIMMYWLYFEFYQKY